jgi:putative hydrolase of the HAD superfamily
VQHDRPVQLVLFDLDGVVRRWEPDIIAAAEREHGLPPGALAAAAFAPDLLTRAVTGRISDAAWREQVAARLRAAFAVDGVAAVAAWSEPTGTVDADVLDLVRATRARCRVGLLTNATTRLRSDLARLGISDEFDVVLNSAELGLAKPDPDLYAAVVARECVEPPAITFIDDSQPNVVAARAAGWDAHVFEDVKRAREFLDRR